MLMQTALRESATPISILWLFWKLSIFYKRFINLNFYCNNNLDSLVIDYWLIYYHSCYISFFAYDVILEVLCKSWSRKCSLFAPTNIANVVIWGGQTSHHHKRRNLAGINITPPDYVTNLKRLQTLHTTKFTIFFSPVFNC